MITADAEHEPLAIIVAGRRHARKERKLLVLVISHEHCTASFTVKKTKLLMTQKNAAVGDGICSYD